MTRICEKFIEELTSGNRQFSTELREHLAVCPECAQAAASLNLLKSHRKALSGREAAAIATILKAAKAEAAATAASVTKSASAASTAAASASTSMLRNALIVLLGLAIVSAVFINSGIENKNQNTRFPPPLRHIQPANMPDTNNTAPPLDLTPPELAEHLAVTSLEPDKASDSAKPDQPANATEEAVISTATEFKMVSPDAEEVSP